MYYVCIEHDQVTSILNYEPNVPEHMRVVHITDAEYAQIQAQSHYFDVTTLSVQSQPEHVTQMQAQQELNRTCMRYLASTDWQVLRHIRQCHLGMPTSLTTEAYTQLEQQRQQAADSIKIV